jgi:hypothetical protein
MNLGFQDRFVPYVEDCSKTHSIRGGFRWRPGMRVHLFARPRQVGMRLIYETVRTSVQRIEIHRYQDCAASLTWLAKHPNHVLNAHRGPKGESLIVAIDGEELSSDEARALFFRDGFREPGICSQYQALQFWAPEPKLLPPHGATEEERAHNADFGPPRYAKAKPSRLPFVGQLIHWRAKAGSWDPVDASLALNLALHGGVSQEFGN